MKLIIGAGDRRKIGWIHHDIQPLEGIDIVCDFWDLPKRIELGTCEQIEMTHVLEHFPMAKTNDVLRLVHSLLAPGGSLYIEVPNLKWNAQELIHNPLSRKNVEYIFGGQRNEWDFHYAGFTPQILVEDLLDAGFILGEMRPNSSIECWVKK